VNTIKQELNIYLSKGLLNFYQIQCITREIGQDKLIKDLTPEERDIINQYLKDEKN